MQPGLTLTPVKWSEDHRRQLIDKLEDYRLSKSMTIKKTVRVLGITASTYHRWRSGEMMIGRIWAYKLEQFLKTKNAL